MMMIIVTTNSFFRYDITLIFLINSFCRNGYEAGDVLGFFIHLPEDEKLSKNFLNSHHYINNLLVKSRTLAWEPF